MPDKLQTRPRRPPRHRISPSVAHFSCDFFEYATFSTLPTTPSTIDRVGVGLKVEASQEQQRVLQHFCSPLCCRCCLMECVASACHPRTSDVAYRYAPKNCKINKNVRIVTTGGLWKVVQQTSSSTKLVSNIIRIRYWETKRKEGFSVILWIFSWIRIENYSTKVCKLVRMVS